MELKKILNKQFILERGIYNPIFLSNLKNIIFKNKLLDQKVLKGIGKGKWLLHSFLIKEKVIDISSICVDKVLIGLLKKILQSNEKILLNLYLDYQLQENNKKQTKEALLINIKSTLKIKIESEPEDEESSTLRIKSKAVLNKQDLLKFLNNLFSNFYSNFPYILLKIKTKSNLLNIKMDRTDLNVTYNIKTKKNLLGSLNKLYFSNNKKIPSYCLWYANIEKIESGWYGIRKGYLIQEYGSQNKKKIKKYKF